MASSNGQAMNGEKQHVVYGELIVLGYNGSTTLFKETQQKRPLNRFSLYQRGAPNGVRKCRQHSVPAAKQSVAVLDAARHSIAFTLNKHQAVVVEYKHDSTTDMFQIGRSSEPQIDFTVVDTWLGLSHSHDREPQQTKLQSTISRYACRILVERESPYRARLYAAGFDASRNIFLGEKATKWKTAKDEIDGLTTNGILILHPSCDDSEGSSNAAYVWKEASVGGDVYSLRETRSAAKRGDLIENDSNILTDGTLIDLCGATLLWRTAEGLAAAPTKKQLESRLDELNAGRPQCPVNLNTLVIPRSRGRSLQADKLPCVYLSCGHVQGRHAWGHKEGQKHECPLCQIESSSIIELSMGMEPAFHLNSDPLNFAFNPCGHMASEKTVRYWSRIPMPHGSSSFTPVCPFCTSQLDITKSFVRLIFQDNCDF